MNSAVVPFTSTISLSSFPPRDFGDGEAAAVKVVLTLVRVGNAKAHAYIAGQLRHRNTRVLPRLVVQLERLRRHASIRNDDF